MRLFIDTRQRERLARHRERETMQREAEESDFKWKEVLHCRKISIFIVRDFQSSKIVVIAEHLKRLRVISFLERDARREERRGERRGEEEEDLRNRLRLRRGESVHSYWSLSFSAMLRRE